MSDLSEAILVVADKSDVAYASSANGQNFKVFCRNQISDSVRLFYIF